MALPTTGAISMGDINAELGRSRTSSISLDTAENGGYVTINSGSPSKPSSVNPATLSEWRGYNHSYTANYRLYVNVPSGGLNRSIIFLNSSSVQIGVLNRNSASMNIELAILVGQPIFIRSVYAGSAVTGPYTVRTNSGTLIGTLSWTGTNNSNTLGIGNAGSLPAAFLNIGV